MRALSRRNDDPDARDAAVRRRPRRLRDGRGRRGARARGARAREGARREDLRRAAGYGVSADARAHHRARPDRAEPGARDEDGARGRRRRRRTEIDYINAHGTSTPLGDASETRVIKLALGEEHAHRIPVSVDEGRDRALPRRRRRGRGDLLDARASARASLPPTINFEVADPDCDLDYIPNEAREADVRVAVSNSFGFGGHNAYDRAAPLRAAEVSFCEPAVQLLAVSDARLLGLSCGRTGRGRRSPRARPLDPFRPLGRARAVDRSYVGCRYDVGGARTRVASRVDCGRSWGGQCPPGSAPRSAPCLRGRGAASRCASSCGCSPRRRRRSSASSTRGSKIPY